MAYTMFFATSTGKTEDVADKLKELLPGTESKDVDSIGSAAELAEAWRSFAVFLHGIQGQMKVALVQPGILMPKKYQAWISAENQ